MGGRAVTAENAVVCRLRGFASHAFEPVEIVLVVLGHAISLKEWEK
jgi:hypothetical protein